MPNTPRTGFQNMSTDAMTGAIDDQLGDVQQADELDALVPLLAEMGSTGLKRSAGFVDEEFLPHLRGRDRRRPRLSHVLHHPGHGGNAGHHPIKTADRAA